MALLLTQTFFADFFLALYHSSIACIRQQSLPVVDFVGVLLKLDVDLILDVNGREE